MPQPVMPDIVGPAGSDGNFDPPVDEQLGIAVLGGPALPKVRIRSHRFAQSEPMDVEGRLAAIEKDSEHRRTMHEHLVARMEAIERHMDVLMRKSGITNMHDSRDVGMNPQSDIGSIVSIRMAGERFDDSPDELGEVPAEEKNSVHAGTRASLSSIENAIPIGSPLDCKWSHSLWDALIFIGVPGVSRSDSTLLALLLVVCILVQVVFLGITRLIFNEPQFSDERLHRLESWRRNIGQNSKYYDQLSFTSLTQRVCHPGVYEPEMSSGTSQLVSEMLDYIGTHDLFNGPSLVMVALLVWGLTVIREFMDLWDLSRAIRALPKVSRCPFVEVVGAHSDRLRVVSITLSRCCWIVLIILWRFGTTIALWGFGNIFLCQYSIDPGEILLNALSLEIVLRIDETMYILVPSRVKQIISRVEPLKAPNRFFQFSNTDLRPYFFFLFMFATILGIGSTVLQESAAAISAANATLCGGRQDFVYSVDPLYMVYTSETNPKNVSTEQFEAFGVSTAIRETIFPATIPMIVSANPSDPSKQMSAPNEMTIEFTVNPLEEVMERSAWGMGEAAAGIQTFVSQECSDIVTIISQLQRFLNESANVVLNALQINRTIANVQTCEDVEALCLSWAPVRSFCPQTCGCMSPLAPLLQTVPSQGCPAACLDQAGYKDELARLACTEKSPIELSQDELWAGWAGQFFSALQLVFKATPGQTPCGSTCIADFRTMGCEFIPHWRSRLASAGWNSDPCTGNFLGDVLLTKPLAVYCPITCGCTNGTRTEDELVRAGCPGQCAAGDR